MTTPTSKGKPRKPKKKADTPPDSGDQQPPRPENKQSSKNTQPPEQQLGDTPVMPWDMPTPEEKEEAKPVRRALKKAVAKVDSQEKADEVIENLEAATAGEKATDVQQSQPEQATPKEPEKQVAEAARKVEKAAEKAPEGKKTEEVLKTTAEVLATGDKRQNEAVSEAVQEVMAPQQQGAQPKPAEEQQRQYLRQAVLKRLKPLDALDADVFLLVNHLPHTHLLNRLFYGLTLAYRGAIPWYAVMGWQALWHRRDRNDIFQQAVLPLLVSNLLVEIPIKLYFKRRRPFISIIQAIVIGKKPGTWSFPSGHSAGAFAGAWLLNRRHPRWSAVTYTIAALVAFSRIYLGDHYPGDVVSGSLSGTAIAAFFSWLAGSRAKRR